MLHNTGRCTVITICKNKNVNYFIYFHLAAMQYSKSILRLKIMRWRKLKRALNLHIFCV